MLSVYRIAIVHLLFALFIFFFQCKSADSGAAYKNVTVDSFRSKNWQEKMDYLEKAKNFRESKERTAILSEALNDKNSAVVLKAMENLPDFYKKKQLDQIAIFLTYAHPLVRWNSCLVIEEFGSSEPEFIPQLTAKFDDKEWMVRECAVRTLRNYQQEKKEKKYLFLLLSRLNEKNALVLKQIYKTLHWYNDPRVFPYIFQRSFHAKNSWELVIIMNELILYDNPSAIKRIEYLSINHPEPLIRQEAKKLLENY